MTTSFEGSRSLLLTSESVTEGHPDKLCDQVSDAVLDAILTQDPEARVACETATTTGFVLVFGEITTSAYVDLQAVVRNTVREIGYDRSDLGFDWETCGVLNAIKKQSADIALGVDRALEARERAGEVDRFDGLVVDDGEKFLIDTVEESRGQSGTEVGEDVGPSEPFNFIEGLSERLKGERPELVVFRLNGSAETGGRPVTSALHIPAVVRELVEELDELLAIHLG